MNIFLNNCARGIQAATMGCASHAETKFKVDLNNLDRATHHMFLVDNRETKEIQRFNIKKFLKS